MSLLFMWGSTKKRPIQRIKGLKRLVPFKLPSLHRIFHLKISITKLVPVLSWPSFSSTLRSFLVVIIDVPDQSPGNIGNDLPPLLFKVFDFSGLHPVSFIISSQIEDQETCRSHQGFLINVWKKNTHFRFLVDDGWDYYSIPIVYFFSPLPKKKEVLYETNLKELSKVEDVSLFYQDKIIKLFSCFVTVCLSTINDRTWGLSFSDLKFRPKW